jgi:hypothetical protein
MEDQYELKTLEEDFSHNLLGLYSFICEPGAGTVDIIPLRHAGLHLNALSFLEPPPLVNVTIEGKPQFSGNILDVDIGIRNPFLGQTLYTGFDVCGIIFTHGSQTGFSDPDIIMAGEGDTRLLNADGYTRWWNPSEFPHGDTIFNYVDGLLGNPADSADFNCTINGYKYFADGLEKDDPLTALNPVWRGMFQAGQKNIRHYTIDLSGGLIFNYAVDACWKFPTGEPPYNPQTDFPPEANRPEAYNVTITTLESDLYYDESTGEAGGDLRLLIGVFDHFNANLNAVYAESLAGLPLTQAGPIVGGDGYSAYEIGFTGDSMTHSGSGELLITVQSEKDGHGSILPGKPVCAYFTYTFSINSQSPQGWARTWGGESAEYGLVVAVDNSGFGYVTGTFKKTVDFDPGPGVVGKTSNGADDIFLSKFDQDGGFIWARAWGGYKMDVPEGIAVDSYGDVFNTGYYRGTVDFNPGPGTEEYISNGENDIYLTKLSSNGDFLWAYSIGGIRWDSGQGIALDEYSDIYITGNYNDIVDFEPGPGVKEHISSGKSDAFLCKFGSLGDFQWALTWGGENEDWVNGIAVDSNGDVYVIGAFKDSADFDPGPGVDEHNTHGIEDAFLSKFDHDGDFKWARTWGGDGVNHPNDIAVDSSGNVYITGWFSSVTDFDPSPGVYNRVANGSKDVFISKFDSNGEFQWAYTWGGTGLGKDYGNGAAIDGYDNLYIVGEFRGTADFDPGPAYDYRTSNGLGDIFLSKFGVDGELIWACTIGGIGNDEGNGVATDGSSNIYITGQFQGTVDFDPGPGGEYHTSNGHNDSFLCKFPPDGNW